MKPGSRRHIHRAALSLCLFATVFCVEGPRETREERPSIDWKAVAAPDVVEISTRDEDGSERRTKIWIVLVNGQAYIRTGNTQWFENLERDPDAVLHSGDGRFPVRVEFVTDAALAAQADAAFREKHGFADRMSNLFRFGDANIMRLRAR